MLDASGDVQVSGAANGDHGSYPLTLTASVDSISSSASFTLEIINPCSQAVFEALPAPIVDMVIDVGKPTQLT